MELLIICIENFYITLHKIIEIKCRTQNHKASRRKQNAIHSQPQHGKNFLEKTQKVQAMKGQKMLNQAWSQFKISVHQNIPIRKWIWKVLYSEYTKNFSKSAVKMWLAQLKNEQ